MQNKKELAKVILNKGNELCFKACGISMEPLIYNEYKIKLISYKNNKYNIGDIVLYEYNGEFVLHRIIKQYDDSYLCKGDNAITAEIIPINKIIAKAKSVIDLNSSEFELIYDSNAVVKKICELSYDFWITTQKGQKKEMWNNKDHRWLLKYIYENKQVLLKRKD